MLPRSPSELRTWVLEKCSTIANVKEAKRAALLHFGLFKKFYEEIFPFSLLVSRVYGNCTDVLCLPNLDETKDFDAEVKEPSRSTKVEITQARQGDEHLRMEYFLEHGHVSFSGPLVAQGPKGNRRITVETMFLDHNELRTRHFRLIEDAARRKAGPGRYGQGYELLIAVEDWWFDPEMDLTPVQDFAAHELLNPSLRFDAVHLVGLTGDLYWSSPCGGGMDVGKSVTSGGSVGD